MDDWTLLESPGDPAVTSKLADWVETAPEGGVLALVAERQRDAVPELQRRFSQAGYPLAGAVFPGLVVEGAFVPEGVLLLHFAQMPAFALVEEVSHRGGALAETARAMLQRRENHRTGPPAGGAPPSLFLLMDAMVPNVATVLDELYLQLADRVRYVGVNAGSESFQPIPCLFDGHRLMGNGVLAVLLEDDFHSLVEHGYQTPEHMTAATSTRGNRIVSIDWRPAFEVYRELALSNFGVSVDRDNFYELAVHFPFGIVRIDGEVVVRIPVALDQDGSVVCVGEVPENAVLTLLHAPTLETLDTVDIIAAELGSGEMAHLLVFYCAGRRLHLGEVAAQELRSLSRRLAPTQILGALSLGEIGASTNEEYPLFHNAALVCCGWSGP